MVRRVIGFGVLAVVLLGACGKRESAEGPPPEPAVVHAPAGAKVAVAAGAVAAPHDLTLTVVSPGYRMHADQAYYADGVEVTMPFDPAKIPAGRKASEMRVLLGTGGATERLDVPVKIAADGRHGTFQIKRVLPLAAIQGVGAGRPAGGGEDLPEIPGLDAELTLASESLELTVLEDTPQWKISAAKPVAANYTPALCTAAKDALDRARTWYMAHGFAAPEKIELEFKPLRQGVAGQASGGKLIEFNSDYVKGPEYFATTVAPHELFHLVQQIVRARNVLTSHADMLVKWQRISWLDEGTAEFMAARYLPSHEWEVVAKMKLDFGFRELDAYDPNPVGAHQYQTYALFTWLAQRYDAERLIATTLDLFMSTRVPERDNTDDEIMEPGAADPRYVLDQVLRKTKDNTGKTRTLRSAYVEMLISLYANKDIPPIRDGAGSEFGPLGTIRTPREKNQAVDCPTFVGSPSQGARTDEVHCNAVSGRGLSIMGAYEITQKLPSGETGSLKLSVDAKAESPKDVYIVAFPRLPGNSGQPTHVTGFVGSSAEIADWQNYAGAVVWVINTSSKPVKGASLTAKFVPKTTPTFALYEKMNKPADLSKEFETDARDLRMEVFCPSSGQDYTRNFNGINRGNEKSKLLGNGLPTMIRVTRPSDGTRRYVYYSRMINDRGETVNIVPLLSMVLWPGSQELLLEALDEKGAVQGSATLKIKSTQQASVPGSPGVLKDIEADKKGTPVNRGALLQDYGRLAKSYASEGRLDDAAKALDEGMNTNTGGIKGSYYLYFLYLRAEVAQTRCDLVQYVDTCERIIKIDTLEYGEGRLDKENQAAWYEKEARAYLQFGADYTRAKQAFQKANALLGKPDREWPYWPALKDLK